MNKGYKQLLALLALAGISNKLIEAHEYDFKNMIGDPIVLKINQSRSDKKDYYQIVYPGKTVKQTFPMGNAYLLAPNGIQWAPYNKANPFNGGADFIDKTNLRIPEEKQREFGDKIAPHYTFLPVEIVMLPNAVYDELSKSATQLLKGIDALACQTIESVKALKNPLSGVGGGSGGGGAATPKQSEAEKNTQATELLEQLQTLISNVDVETATSLEKLKGRNAIESLLSKDNVSLLKNTAKLSNEDMIAIKTAVNLYTLHKRDALQIIEKAINTILTTKTKIDTDVSINTLVDSDSSYSSDYSGYLSSYSSDSSSGGKSSAPQTQSNSKCSFGLGKIGKASGKLAKMSLTSREFTIYYKIGADDLPIIDKYGRPVLVAETVEGQ